MAQFNSNDPRYQREIQKAAAKRSMGPFNLERVTTGEIAGRHAGYQLGRQEQFKQLALRSKLSKQYGTQFDRTHALNVSKQDFREGEFADQLSRDKKGLNQTMLMGGLGSAWSVAEGRRRNKLLQSELAERRYNTSLMNDYMFRQLAPYGSRLTSEEQ